MFEAVLFDWDGTLADTKSVIVISFQKALKEINLTVSAQYIERSMGIGAADTFRDILKADSRRIDEKVVEKLVKRKSELQIELDRDVKLFEGSRDLLDELRGNLKIGLASMNNRNVIMDLLQNQNLTDYFDVVLTVEAISYSKPNPEIFLKTARALNSSPVGCVVFEDSIFGVKAAKAAGMSCVAVTTGAYNGEELAAANPDLIVENLKDEKILSFVLK